MYLILSYVPKISNYTLKKTLFTVGNTKECKKKEFYYNKLKQSFWYEEKSILFRL